MPKPLSKIAFIIEDFALHSPGQQLLDRFALGYPDNGEFRRLHDCAIAAHVVRNPADAEFLRRDKALQLSRSFEECLAAADAAVVAPRNLQGNPALVHSVLDALPHNARCFVYGSIADTEAQARQFLQLAEARQCFLAAGTATAAAWRLPEVTLPKGAAVRRALVVVQGGYPAAEIEALNALLPVTEEAGQRSIEALEFHSGTAALAALEHDFAPLLASAISRSDTPQGDAVVDARTQDLFRLGLIPKLAQAPRCWLLRHSPSAPGSSGSRPGFPSMIAVLDGVVADCNLAVQTASGTIWSWQVYRPPAPFEHVYSRLAGIIESYFRSGVPPWPPQRLLVPPKALELFNHRRSP